MEKFIPYEKLSKKQKRQLDTQKRRTWGTQNPVTRTPQNSRAYNRKRAQSWKKDLPPLRPFLFFRKKEQACACSLAFLKPFLPTPSPADRGWPR